MCSGGSCDMAGLIGGPVGNLVGMGIKALVNGAPIGPRTAEALKKPTEQEGIKQFYDNVETHLKGMLQVLEPALEIKKILCGESKSADRERSAKHSQSVIQYYSPQNLGKTQPGKKFQTGCCASKKSTSHLSTGKPSFKTPISHNSKIEKLTERKSCCSRVAKSNERPSQSTLSSHSKSSNNRKEVSKSRSTNLSSEASFQSCCSTKSKEKSCKSSGKDPKSTGGRPKMCCICDVSLKDNIVLAVLPCQHLFCYTCLAAGNGKCCRQCDKTYDMKNVSQIFH